jgi:hypothetical protein
MFNITDQVKLFNEYITPGVTAEIVAISKLWDRLKKSDKLEPHGLYAKQRLMSAAGTSTRASSNSSYPTAHSSTPQYTLTYLKRAQMFTMQFDGFSLELASKNGAAMDPIEFEKKGLFISQADDLSRQLMLDGSGTLCVNNGGISGDATCTVDSPFYADATKFLKKGQILDVYLLSGPTQEVNSVAVSSVTDKLNFEFASAVTITNNAVIKKEDVYTATEGAGLGEMMGLDGIIRATDPPVPNASGGLQGLTVANDAEWAAYVNGNSGTLRDLTEDLLTACFDEVEPYGKVSVLLATNKVRRVWASYLSNFKSLVNQKSLWGGWSGLPFIYDGREVPMVTDRFVPDGCIYGVAEDMLQLFVTKVGNEITWEQGDAGNILQKVANKNEYVAEGHIFANMGTPFRKGCGFKLYDLNEPS